MKSFLEYLAEAAEVDGKLKHLQHLEDLHVDHGKEGFEHAVGALHKTEAQVWYLANIQLLVNSLLHLNLPSIKIQRSIIQTKISNVIMAMLQV